MRWSEVFEGLPERLKDAWSREPALRRRLAAGHALYDVLTNPDHLEATYAEMGRTERAALRAIVRHLGPALFTDADYMRLMRTEASGAEARHALIALRRKGAVLAMRKLWEERVYAIPWDAWTRWRTICFPDAPAPPPADPERITPHPAGPGAAEDVFRLVSLIREQRPVLTRRGLLPRSFVRSAAPLLSLGEDGVGTLPVRSPLLEAYPKPLLVILDLALKLGVIGWTGGRAEVREGPFDRWLAKSRAEQDAELYGMFRETHLPPEAGFLHFAAVLETLPRGTWYSLRDIARAAGWPFPGLALQRLKDEWLGPLAALGFLRLGVDDSGDVHALLPEPSEPWDEWYVQDDFEIVAPPQASFRLRRDLERIASVATDAGAVRGRLERTSVWRMCSEGCGADEIVALLNRHAACGVPDQVEQAVRQWAGEYGRMRLVEAVLLRCRDERCADELEGVPALKGILLERIGGRDFLVDGARRRELSKWLAEAGYSAAEERAPDRPEAERPEAERPEEREPGRGTVPEYARKPEPESARKPGPETARKPAEAPEGLLPARLARPRFEWDADLPDVRSLYPDLAEVPAIWLKELRPYHDSTRKDLIRRAIALEAPVRLRLGGNIVRCVPRRIEGAAGDWQVVAVGADGRERRFGWAEWEEMQLILPGINDTTDVGESLPGTGE